MQKQIVNLFKQINKLFEQSSNLFGQINNLFKLFAKTNKYLLLQTY